jgi:pyruvate kinase
MDVARLNFSHSTHDYHKSLVKKLRDLSSKHNHQVKILTYSTHQKIGILCDIQGPKIRVGDVKDPFVVSIGDKISITSRKVLGTPELITIDYPPLLLELDGKSQYQYPH